VGGGLITETVLNVRASADRPTLHVGCEPLTTAISHDLDREGVSRGRLSLIEAVTVTRGTTGRG
jgi:hypothetical protein